VDGSRSSRGRPPAREVRRRRQRKEKRKRRLGQVVMGKAQEKGGPGMRMRDEVTRRTDRLKR